MTREAALRDALSCCLDRGWDCKTGNIRHASAQQHEQRTGQQDSENREAEQDASCHRWNDGKVLLCWQDKEALVKRVLAQYRNCHYAPPISRAAFTCVRNEAIISTVLVVAFVEGAKGGEFVISLSHNQRIRARPVYTLSLAAQQSARRPSPRQCSATRACHFWPCARCWCRLPRCSCKMLDRSE